MKMVQYIVARFGFVLLLSMQPSAYQVRASRVKVHNLGPTVYMHKLKSSAAAVTDQDSYKYLFVQTNWT